LSYGPLVWTPSTICPVVLKVKAPPGSAVPRRFEKWTRGAYSPLRCRKLLALPVQTPCLEGKALQ